MSIDVAMFVTMLVSMVSGVVLWLFIPSGRRSGYTTFLSLAKHLWTDIHIYVSLIFCGVLLPHLVLNLRLFSSMVKYMFKRGPNAPEAS